VVVDLGLPSTFGGGIVTAMRRGRGDRRPLVLSAVFGFKQATGGVLKCDRVLIYVVGGGSN
jgi:hypothetical protein